MERYVIATLTEGLGETQARRFLAKIDIKPPNPKTFYRAQKRLEGKIAKIVENDMAFVRANLQADSIFGLDCSWSGRRGASHAIVIFMEMRSRLIFDKVVVSKNPKVSDIEFHSTSNLMETMAVKSKVEYLTKNYKFIGFVHDFDIDTAPILHRDENCGQLVEYLDPGHLKKTLENPFKTHNTDGALYKLKNEVISRFASIVRNQNLSTAEKLEKWLSLPDEIIKNGKNKGYLIADEKKKSKRRITPEVAKAALLCFLNETTWLVVKCSFATTQDIEAFNGSCKAKLCPKHLHFQKGFKLRNYIAILKWNHPQDWFYILESALQLSSLSFECLRVLKSDSSKLNKAREKARTEKARITRNIKRKLSRVKNKIEPDGHLYASDIKKEKSPKKVDPTRKTLVLRVPFIRNDYSSNCFINSVIQLLRHTNIEVCMRLNPTNDIVQLMLQLNKGHSVSDPNTINEMRKTWTKFNTLLEEDASEFLVWLMNEIFETRKTFVSIPSEILPLLSREPETFYTFQFLSNYRFSTKRTITCPQCKHISIIFDHDYTLSIPTTSAQFHQNIEKIYHDTLDYECDCCKQKVAASMELEIVQLSNYIFIVINRFTVNDGIIHKDDKLIVIPDTYTFKGTEYKKIGIVYHIGQTPLNGHYLSKYVDNDGHIETYDDSRCYKSFAESELPDRNAYIILFQQSENRKANMSRPSKDEDEFIKAKEIIQKHLEKGRKTIMKKETNSDVESNSILNTRKPKRFLDKKEICLFFRTHSYYCDLYSFDLYHNITSINEFEAIFMHNIDILLRFHAGGPLLIIKFFRCFTKSKCITDSIMFFIEAFLRVIVNSSYESSALERIHNFGYVMFSYLDPLKVIASLFEKFEHCTDAFSCLNEILEENEIDYKDMLSFERVESTDCDENEQILLLEQSLFENSFEEVSDDILSFSDILLFD